MKNVAVIGVNGFVGSQIVNAINKNDCYNLIPISRNDSAEDLIPKADIIIYSANPAGRFQAENHPIVDFEETVEKTARFFSLAQGKRLY